VEIEQLYRRFERLDRDRSGSLSAEKLLGIPEFAMNPLGPRILAVLMEQHSTISQITSKEITFPTFIRFLSVFHPSAPSDEKLDCIFQLFLNIFQ